MYIYSLVNTNLKMGKGKVAAQVAHGVQMVTEYLILNDINTYYKYKRSGMAKIVLKASENDMEQLFSIFDQPRTTTHCFRVEDAGCTQIPEGSFTVLSFIPMTKERATFLNDYKLL